MTERIDHVAEAKNYLGAAIIDTYGDDDRKVAIAQVHATLTLERVLGDLVDAELRAAELAAVIERAKAVTAWATGGLTLWQQRGLDTAEGYNEARDEFRAILNTAPADALRAVKAEAIREVAEQFPDNAEDAGVKPAAVRKWLNARAHRIETKEQD